MKKFTFYLCCILCAVICAVGLMTQDQRTDPVEAKKKIRIGVLRDRPPLASMVDGSPEGLAVELVHGICSTLNIEEEFAFGRAVELYEQLEKGTIELAVLVPRVTGQTSRLTFIPTGFRPQSPHFRYGCQHGYPVGIRLFRTQHRFCKK